MLGVQVNTSARTGPSTPLRESSGQFFVVGIFERGVTDEAMILRSKSDLYALCGERTAYSTAYDQLVSFFDEGGRQARVARVVGEGATVGTASLMDGDGSATLTVNAASPGVWSSNVGIKVVRTSDTDFRIEVYYSGILIDSQSGMTSPADAVQRFKANPYVRLVNAGSTVAAPANNPVELSSPVLLSAGDDMRSAIVADNYVAALKRFSYEMGDGAVSIPGQTTGIAQSKVIEHCKENNRIAILAAPRDESKAELISRAASITQNAEYAGLFAPWVLQSDGAFGTRAISPEGYVAAARAKSHGVTGPWRSPAGSQSTAQTLAGVDKSFSGAEANDLYEARVSPIRKPSSSAGVRLFGWRSLSKDAAYKHLKTRDLLNYLAVNAERVLEDFLFQNIDSSGHLASKVATALVGLVEPIAQAGGFYALIDGEGNEIDPGYLVDVSDAINSLASLANDELRARIAVRDTPQATMISVDIVKVGVTEALG